MWDKKLDDMLAKARHESFPHNWISRIIVMWIVFCIYAPVVLIIYWLGKMMIAWIG